MFESSDLYRTNWRKRYFDALTCYRTDIRSFRAPENMPPGTCQPLITDDFPAVWNYGKLSIKIPLNLIWLVTTVSIS